jgi:hypothetical protein
MTATPRSAHDLIITRAGRTPDAPDVLLLRESNGWRLPRVDSEERRSADVGPLNLAVREDLGLEISILRCLRDGPAEPAGVRWQVSEAEWHGGNAGADTTWADAERLDATPLALPSQRELLHAWLGERRARVPSRDRGDWAFPGWRDQATAWVEAALRNQPRAPRVAQIEQLRAWEFSCVLRFGTDSGDFFLKAVPRAAAAETALTPRIAETHPRLTPPVVAADAERGWLLTRGVAGASLMRTPDVICWTRAAEACARIQIDWLERGAELERLGCPLRGLDWLEAQIEPLVEDTGVLRGGPPDSLDEAEMAELHRRAPSLAAACRELAGYGVPAALEHGDLWAENVVAAPGASVLIDWEDAALTHPFFSPSLLIASLEYTDALSRVPGARGLIREAYLTPWRSSGPTRSWPGGRLEAAFDLAQRLAMLYYSAQFRLFSVPRVETSWEVRSFAPFFARRLLASSRRA